MSFGSINIVITTIYSLLGLVVGLLLYYKKNKKHALLLVFSCLLFLFGYLGLFCFGLRFLLFAILEFISLFLFIFFLFSLYKDL
ncbi:MAG: hypothetical protein HQ564_06505 [Candidatus Saganbacteria bacterium]|nr:hypothetical protein [Candidatus Saganbacteria bacterium]